MFKEFTRGLTSFFTSDKILILVVFLVLVLVLSMYSGSKVGRIGKTEGMTSFNARDVAPSSSSTEFSKMESTPAEVDSSSIVPDISSMFSGDSSTDKTALTNPTDLLPADQNSQWASLNPTTGNSAFAPDLLQAGYHIGLDTIGQTLRNPSYDLRSDPIIPKMEVGPWNQSTIEPDFGRVPFEIGAGAR